MEKLEKCVSFILTVSVFFCNQLYLLTFIVIITFFVIIIDRKRNVFDRLGYFFFTFFQFSFLITNSAVNSFYPFLN
jgi:hypothetical protein